MADASDKIEVVGLRELRRALKAAEQSIDELKDANRAAGEMVADTARSIVPKLTGRLARSIRPNRAQSSAVVKAGGARLPYAGVIHFGWAAHNIEPTPYLYDALDRRRGDVIEAYERQIEKITAGI